MSEAIATNITYGDTKVERANTELAKVIELFGSKELPEFVAKAYLLSPNKPSSHWSMSNRLIMLKHETADSRTFNQWKQIGRYIKKGTKGFYIIAPMMKKVFDTDKVTGEKKERMIVSGFTTGEAEFRYEDTEGQPIEELQPKEPIPLLEVATKWGSEVKFAESILGEAGHMHIETKAITICTPAIDTYFHELIHVAHGRIEELKPGQDKEQEIIAALGATVLARIYGMSVENYQQNYIAEYVKSKNPEVIGKECMKLANKVEKILKLILEEESK